jgi:protein-S-isoprenylcysteine O-methyltransferase Ste14
MAFVILLAICAVILLPAGLAMVMTQRADPREKEQWRRRAPYVYLGAGLVVLIAGWLSNAGVASWVQMAAGATLAVSGSFLAVRNWSSSRG